MSNDRYTYRVTWSTEQNKHMGLCAEFSTLSWLDSTPEAALKGIRQLVAKEVEALKMKNKEVPQPLAEKVYSGQFRVRVTPEVHKMLAIKAAEQGVSMNHLASSKLAG